MVTARPQSWLSAGFVATSFAVFPDRCRVRPTVQVQHRQWMTRSLAMAVVFLEVRVIVGLSGWERLGVSAVETVVWTCVALAYPLADVVLLVEERLRVRMANGAPGGQVLAGDLRRGGAPAGD